MLKCLSFSLYGNDNEYIRKFINNLPLYKKYFSDYDIILYADNKLKELMHDFCINNSVKVFYESQKYQSDGMFWRFYPILSKSYDVVLVRDVDYLPSEYELQLINQFIESRFLFHIIRSHHDHKMPIMGGLFGIKKALFNDFQLGYIKWKSINENKYIKYNDDQLFLANYIYKKVYKASLIHSKNIVFLGEKVNFINPPDNFIIGGDDKHTTDFKKNNFIYYYLPVWVLFLLKYRALNYLRIKFKNIEKH